MSRTSPDVIIVRGAPGTGKTQASKCLAAHFPKGVRIEVDTLRAMVVSVDWTNQAEHANILSLSTSLVAGFLRLGYKPVILVDTFSGSKLTTFLAELHSLDASLNVQSFALAAAPEALRARVHNRPSDQFRDHEICQKLNLEVLQAPHPIDHVIDVTTLTPDEIANLLLDTSQPTSQAVR